MSSDSASEGPKILASSCKLQAKVLLILVRVSLASYSWIGFNSGQKEGPNVNKTAGKLNAQW